MNKDKMLTGQPKKKKKFNLTAYEVNHVKRRCKPARRWLYAYFQSQKWTLLVTHYAKVQER